MALARYGKENPFNEGALMANLECFACKNLVAIRTQTSVKRSDGTFETATAFGCKARNAPLPSISRHDLAGCPFYEAGARQERWRMPNEEVWDYR